MLYTLQNSLQYVAVSNLDAATFQITYQLKILTTAIFSITMLGHTLGLRKWSSLLLLIVGVAIVQIPAGSDPAMPTLKDLKEANAGLHLPRTIQQMRDMGSSAAGQLTKRSATYEGIDKDFAMQHPQLDASIGLAAVLVACLLSGLAGVYFEKVLKGSTSQTSLWFRNVQLSFYSLFPSLFIGVVFKDGADIAKHGFFSGYNWIVWSAILLQAFGGVLVLSLEQVGEVGLDGAYSFRDFDHDATFFQGHLIPLLQVIAASPVKVAEEISRNVVDHDTLVEGVVSKKAILPSLLLAT
ncbi:nucleotide-sugar transporter [Aureobasidium pullulans]|uniref:Nucleotide-sugar transporter n=1 Tax=Aureobasidium pullulans TaxID=5580 RepID=A0A4T0A9N6_AURPU|nr:nucleotide-sugar transporter [Aureobasidium pullulans]